MADKKRQAEDFIKIVRSFLKGYFRCFIRTLIEGGYTRDEAVNMLQSFAELERQEPLFESKFNKED
jgi:hypothetical protein